MRRQGPTPAVRTIAARLAGTAAPLWLVLNKIDLVARPSLLPLAQGMAALAPFARTFMVSAATGDGVEALLDALAAAMPEGPHLYPDDELSDMPDRMLAAETVREQVFWQTHEEVPYGTTVETESWAERDDGSVRIDATIYVARPGQKAILIGEGGARIRADRRPRPRRARAAAGAAGASVPEREGAAGLGRGGGAAAGTRARDGGWPSAPP